ncbi:MAG: ABC-2 transporter permease, partial [Clostridia bacterium]|nr:ABC-2 transporter permease [Clostridia bacterium]
MIKVLILKDFLLQKKTALFGLAYSIFLMAIFNSTTFSSSVYILCTVAISYMLIMGAVAYDDKNKSDTILNSLPLQRKTIVQAKYASVFVFGLGAILTIGLLGALLKAAGLPFPGRFLNPTDVIAAFFSLSLVSAMYLPFYYRFGYIASRLFNVVFFMLAFFA